MILEYKDVPVYYEDEGEGKTVVLLHGFLETSSMWKDLVNDLGKLYRIISIDLLGHGQSGCLGYIHTMEMMAEAVAFVLESLDIKKAILVGHSMGGYVGLAFAENFPDKVMALCLMNSTPFSDNKERRTNRDRAVKAVKHNHRNFIRMSIVNLFSADNRELFAKEIEAIKSEALKLPVQGIVAALEGMKVRKDRSVIFKTVTIPKIVFLGMQDPVLEFDSLSAAMRTMGIETVGFEGGHMSHIENSKELSHKILHFIEK